MRMLLLIVALIWAFPVAAQEHCISPDVIRAHAGDAVIADVKAPGREMIALAAPGETVMLLIYHDDECSPEMARLPAGLFQDPAAFMEGRGA